jgi:hypothetical protein
MYEYSKTMKELMKKRPNIMLYITILLLMVVLAGIGILSYLSEKEDLDQGVENLKVFESGIEVPGYCILTPEFLSEEFASNFDDSIYYCFVIDKDYNSYIVAIRAEDMDQYQDLIEYTYSESVTTAPAPITLKGKSVKIEEDLIDLSVSSFNAFWGSEAVTTDTYETVLGSYYLDTTQEPSADSELLTWCFIFVIALGVVFTILMSQGIKFNKRRQATLDRFQDQALWNVDQELNNPTTISYPNLKLYLTNNFIVSSARGFDIIPYEEIDHLYGYAYDKKKNIIMATTKDGIQHELAALVLNSKNDTMYNQIVEQIKLRLPDIKIGFEDGYFSMLAPQSRLDVDETADGAKSNALLGIIGAILGAVLGGIVWIIIGKMGFIAGIAGFLMMSFAIKGYRKFSGALDKKGQIISVIIAFLMIFVANYLGYALEYCKYYYSGDYSITNLITSFRKLPDFLTLTEIWGSFLKDLVVGYLLSIWSGFGILKSVFTRSNQ